MLTASERDEKSFLEAQDAVITEKRSTNYNFNFTAARGADTYMAGPSTSTGSGWQGLLASANIAPYSTPQQVLEPPQFSMESPIAIEVPSSHHQHSYPSPFRSPPLSSPTEYFAHREGPSDLTLSTRKFGELTLPDPEENQPLDFTKHRRSPREVAPYLGESSYSSSIATPPQLGFGEATRSASYMSSHPSSSEYYPELFAPISAPVQLQEEQADDEDEKIVNVEDLSSEDEHEASQMRERHRTSLEDRETDSDSDEDDDETNIAEFHRSGI